MLTTHSRCKDIKIKLINLQESLSFFVFFILWLSPSKSIGLFRKHLPKILDYLYHNTPHFEVLVSRDFYRLIIRIAWTKPNPVLFPLGQIKIFHRELTVEIGYPNVVLPYIYRTVYHDNVSIGNSGLNHRVTHHLGIKGCRRMSYEFLVQIKCTVDIILRKRREPRFHSEIGGLL